MYKTEHLIINDVILRKADSNSYKYAFVLWIPLSYNQKQPTSNFEVDLIRIVTSFLLSILRSFFLFFEILVSSFHHIVIFKLKREVSSDDKNKNYLLVWKWRCISCRLQVFRNRTCHQVLTKQTWQAGSNNWYINHQYRCWRPLRS